MKVVNIIRKTELTNEIHRGHVLLANVFQE